MPSPTPKSLPSQALLNRLLRYEPETGKLHWRPRDASHFTQDSNYTPEAVCARWNTRFAGKEAFTAVARRRGSSIGYKIGCFLGDYYKAHRIIWKLVHGTEPDHIDHIDGDPRNNRLTNIRDVPQTVNAKNLRLRKDNTTGVVGVYEKDGRWIATIFHNSKNIHVGSFDTFDDAVAARKKAEIAYGFHPNHGRKRPHPATA